MQLFNDKNALILIVDDIPKNLQVLSSILSNKGYQISFAQNGRQALQLIDFNKPDLILLDIMMPEMDGFEVCNILKSKTETAEIPIIFITGKVETEDIVRGFQCGAVDYITKPFNAAELLSRVETHLNLKFSKDAISSYNKQLEEYQKELKEVIAAKDKFFSIIAHDLRGPFSGFLGLSSILEEEYESLAKDELQQIGSSLNAAAERLFALLENLLNWSRSQMGRLEFEPSDFNLKSIIIKVVNLLSTNAEKKNINIINQVVDDLYVFADENMVNAILRNFITNAIKFTNPGGEITISSQLVDDFQAISIKDNGIGMSKEMLDKLFKIDAKITSIGTDNERGTGLGLILIKELIEKHDGTISVSSEVGKGSEFRFTLPISKLSKDLQ